MRSFRDQVVLITGAASGIGRELARQLSAEGARIAALDRSLEGLDSLAAELAGKPYAQALADVTDASAVAQAAGDLERQLGPTHLLIASAGIGHETSALDFRADAVNAQVQVNLIGVINSIAAVLPGMIARRQGHLAALSSLASYRGLPLMAGYCASKAGVNALLDSLRVELRPRNIAVTTICPGWVRTPLTAPIDVPASDMMEVAEAGRRIVAGLHGRRKFVAFPGHGVRRVWLLRHLPLWLSDWMAARYLKLAARMKRT